MVKQLMQSKRELEEGKSAIEKQVAILQRDLDDKETSIALLKANRGKTSNEASSSVQKIDELENQLKKLKDSRQSSSNDDSSHFVPITPWSCSRDAAEITGVVQIDTINTSFLPTITKTQKFDDGDCEIEVGDVLSVVNDVAVSTLPMQLAIEAALTKKGPERFVVPLVSFDEDGDVAPNRGRGKDASMVPGFPLTGVLDIRVVNILSSPHMEIRFEATGEHRRQIEEEEKSKQAARDARLELEQAEVERRRNALTAVQRAEEDAKEAKKKSILAEEARMEEERAAEKAALEQRRREAEEREQKRAWHRSMWKSWREEGREFEYDVDINEETAAKYSYSLGVGFEQGPKPIVNFVKPKSIAATLKIELGDVLMFVNDVNTSSMLTEMAVRTLTLAKWPRNLGFLVPYKAPVPVDDVEEEEEEEEEEMDEAEIAAKLEAYMLDPVAAELAEQKAQDAKELLPRKKGKKKKRPTELLLRILEPEVVAGDYEINVATWGPIFEGPDYYETDDDAEKEAAMFWPCVPLSISSTNPPHGCGDSVEMTVQHEGADIEEVDHEGEWGKDIVDRPEIALVVRGTCVFTDKIRALQPLMLPEGSYAGGSNGQGALVSVAVVINTDDKPLNIPAGQAKVGDLSITVASVNNSIGSVILDAVNFGALSSSDPAVEAPAVRVKGWVGYPDDCFSLIRPDPPPEGARQRRGGDDGGKFVALSSAGDALGPYDFTSALFGPSQKDKFNKIVPTGGVRMVIADPIDACDLKQYKVRMKGLFVVVARGGGCGFADKVMAVQQAGAIGVVVMNTIEGKPTAMMADDSQSAMIKIPAFMVTEGLNEDLIMINKLRSMNPESAKTKLSIIGRFVFEDFYGNYDSE